jgi:hypothetical protein
MGGTKVKKNFRERALEDIEKLDHEELVGSEGLHVVPEPDIWPHDQKSNCWCQPERVTKNLGGSKYFIWIHRCAKDYPS